MILKNEHELGIFIAQNPSPKINTSSTIIQGYISCVRPVPTICGAEIYCNPNDLPLVKKLISEIVIPEKAENER